MKKISIIGAFLALVSFAAQGQGLVNFVNSSSAGSKISTNSVVGGSATALAGGVVGSYYYALFYSTSASLVNGSASSVIPTSGGFGSYAWSDSNWTFSGDYATNTATAGRVLGNSSANGAGAVVSGLAGGAFAQFVVVGWSANLGTTYQQAITSLGNLSSVVGTAYLGESAVSPSFAVGDGVSVPNPTILAASGTVTGFTLGIVPVPEPGTIALATLGGLSMLALRRRKA